MDYVDYFSTLFITYGLKLLYAVLIWVVGKFIIGKLMLLVDKKMEIARTEITLKKFLHSIVNTLCYAFLFIVIISTLGIQTASFVAVLGAMSLAIGFALQGSLANFAGGVLILLFKPFKIGDYIGAAGVSGTVVEIQIFATLLNTPDNKRIVIPNGKLSNDTLTNYSKNPTRRVDITFSVGYNDDLDKAKSVLVDIAKSQEKILKTPDIFVEIIEYGDSSVNIVYRVWCDAKDYWGVYFQSMKMAKIEFDKANISIPYPQMDVHVEK
ncbi:MULTISPECIES: mechanosensitive ion channel family protein [Psychrilyobacter]|uniref:Mechanosensitive ion channel family protein n=1 Tax=Psychrilyobacter piezotolerans TaxID=2293438 RepID=A0ABX9KDV8_9FUSO|nr:MULTISPECIES: mechanosensitive ion channel domain-containing protein [Psychrilyobacter]MCS5422676.1 mechanosensitive ion channel [Psychrilyobacter sp. S5]NDI78971.1 mechanosensitive ion channel [Psychrilyobacter piezotolerans]RDE59194.1 mechanosensitive ion channel family protein [Psychrilyobacter sp. S5]REI39761.1 mechanosensitive ion channel family protein [Psychrilyobacter piezotolerans]